MFTPGQLVVYPAQGVGMIEGITRQQIGNAEVELYVVSILGVNITLMVPVSNTGNVGLRELCSPDEAVAIMGSLLDRTGFTGYTGQNWNRRYREYSERLKSGALADSAHVLKELRLLTGEKELSFGERRLLEQATHLVVMEIACILQKAPEEIKEEIDSFFADVVRPQEKKP